MNAMGCDANECGKWYHYECLESDVRAFADLSLIEKNDWLCEWCVNRIERVCEVCMVQEMVIDDVAKGISSGWVRCENGWCNRWYHYECLPRDDMRALQNGVKDWMCSACFRNDE